MICFSQLALLENIYWNKTCSLKLLRGLVKFCQKFRVVEFCGGNIISNSRITLWNSRCTAKQVRQRMKRRMFVYEGEDEPMSTEEICRANISLKRSFEQINSYDTIWILYHIEELKSIREDKLGTFGCCGAARLLNKP